MKIAGIIAEYNPFHNGHAYQLEKVREETGADHIIVVMSGDFMQRGEPAIADKYVRANMAIRQGADLVLELPVFFSCAGAEYFARGGVWILYSLGCVDTLCFGTEQPDLSDFISVTDVLSEEPERYRELLKDNLRQGLGYPAARMAALHTYLNRDVSFLKLPNNILALEYLCALKKFKSQITPHAIRRVGAGYHDTELSSSFASATALRKAITTGHPISDFMPESSCDLLCDYFDSYGSLSVQDFSLLLQYTLIQIESPNQLASCFDIDRFLANRIFQNRYAFNDFSSFTELLTSRNLTRGHIQRALFHILLNIQEPAFPSVYVPRYTRILGMRRSSSHILKSIRNHAGIPVLTKMADASKSIESFPGSEEDKYAALYQIKQTSTASHIYESVLSQKYHQPFRHENTRQISII